MGDAINHADFLGQLNLSYPSTSELLNIIELKGEAQKTHKGSWNFITGKRTARSPLDRYICKDSITQDTVDWGDVNRPIAESVFYNLWHKALSYLGGDKPVYGAHLQVGASSKHGIPVNVLMEKAWHCLFAHYLFISPDSSRPLENSDPWTVLGVPGLNTDPDLDNVNSDAAIIISVAERKVLLIGMNYAGEIKKSMFSVQNFLLPEQDVLSMHCSANTNAKGDSALFFGLSGTGKTTLSADPERFLIGDDEHAWSEDGIFNLEGGCYAKTVNLSEDEPVILDAIRAGTILENVVVDSKTGIPDYSDVSFTQNTRAAYPRDFIDKKVPDNFAGHPKHVIFLTCDLYGVLPPVSMLDYDQAAYYFLSGYTALVGATEVGQGEKVKSTFSTCFGAPFFPRPATVYAKLLQLRLQQTKAKVYLVNTGWTGGGYGIGKRFPIPVTRRIISAILDDSLDVSDTTLLPLFNIKVPVAVAGVDSNILNPRTTWKDKDAYDKQLYRLAKEFQDNFKKYSNTGSLVSAGPSSGSI